MSPRPFIKQIPWGTFDQLVELITASLSSKRLLDEDELHRGKRVCSE
jgi:hypothetical protein